MKTKNRDYVIIGVVVIALAALYVFAMPEQTFQSDKSEIQDVITCEDTDGTDISMKGTVTYTVNGAESTFTDECSGDILKEYTCNGDRLASRLQKCNCNDGRCI